MNENTLTFFRDLYRFNRWAEDRTIEGVYSLEHDSLYRTLPGGWKNVFQILAHVYAVEALYVARWHGHSPDHLLESADFTGVTDIARKWESLDHEIEQFLDVVDEYDLEKRLRYRSLNEELLELSLAEMVLHTVLHSTFHRGQIQYLVRREGKVPHPIDPLVFFLTHGMNTAIPQTVLRELIEYTRWAENRVHTALTRLSPEKLRESSGGGVGSAWETQVHVIGAMGGWLERMNGEAKFQMLDPFDVNDLHELFNYLQNHLQEMEIISRVREDLTDRIVLHDRKHSLQVTRAQLLFQLLLHTVYHRGQTMMLVRFAGIEPPDTDFVTYALTKATVIV